MTDPERPDTDALPGAGEPDALRGAAETMRAVRDRCVWTQGIDHRALVPYLVEESSELIDAVEAGSRDDLREELGDLLWQVLFHAEIASRDPVDPFDIDDVARGLTDKMVRRHPHVFGGEVARTPEEVLVLWNAAKAAEKHARTSVLDGVSERMPSLALAQKLVGKAAQVGVVPARDLPSSPSTLPAARGPLPQPPTPAAPNPSDRAEPEGEGIGFVEDPRVRADPAPGPSSPPTPAPALPTSEAELGEALLALVAQGRANGWDAERALRERLRVLQTEIRDAETRARDLG